MASAGQLSECTFVRRIDGDYGIWRADGQSLVIEYRLAVLEEIRAAAGEGFRAVPRGGVEIGGVLFGRRQGSLTQITAQRMLDCEHARGPAFVLSERDEAALRGLAASAQSDPALAGLELVGWYHSHTRTEILLDERDLEIYSRFFAEPWQIALVLKPQQLGPTRAGFFFREADGRIHRTASYHEFTVDPYRPARVRRPEGQPAPVALPEPVEPAADPFESAAARLETAARHEPEPGARKHRNWGWLAVALALIFLAIALGARAYFGQRPDPAPALLVRVLDADGQLVISWDQASKPIAEAQRASLEIDDGGEKTRLDLDAEQVRRGTVTYARRSGRVDLRLTVFRKSGAPVEELASFLGQPVSAAPPPDLQEALRRCDEALRERDQAIDEADKLRAALRSQTVRNTQLSDALRALRRRIEVESSLRRRR